MIVMDCIRIDGSYGEGGGQILRSALSLSAVTGKSVEIYNIRAGRKNPGLAQQHLTAIRGVAQLCGGTLNGDYPSSMRVSFTPSKIQAGNYSFDVRTAGSVTLVLQALLPLALCADGEVIINVSGGTDVPWSPNTDFFQWIFCDCLKRFGIDVQFEVLRRGFYPKGGGRVRLFVKPWVKRTPISFTERGELLGIEIKSIATKHLQKARVADRQMDAVKKTLGVEPLATSAEYVDSYSPGSSLHMTARYKKCSLGAGSLGKKGVPAEVVGEIAIKKLTEEIVSCATVDVHTADQLLIYMALAGGGIIISRELTQHVKTNIWLIEQFIQKHFTVERFTEYVKIGI